MFCIYLFVFCFQYTQKKISSNIFRDVGRLLFNIRIDVYLLWCISVGMCTGLIWQFLFWLIEDLASAQGCDALNHVKTLQGIVQAIQVSLPQFCTKITTNLKTISNFVHYSIFSELAAHFTLTKDPLAIYKPYRSYTRAIFVRY